MKRAGVPSAARGALSIVAIACALALPGAARGSETRGPDVCALLRAHAPADEGLVLDQAVSVTPEFCQAWSADRKHTLLLRLMSTGSLPMILAGMRQSAVNGGNGVVADESGLGAGAFSLRSKRSIELTFGAAGNLVQVVLTRDDGFGDTHAEVGRTFARAVAGELR